MLSTSLELSLLQLGVVALGISAVLALFVSLKHEIRLRERKDRARMDAQMEAHREEMRARLAKAAEPGSEPPPPLSAQALLRSGMNMSKRVQALRLLRRGEDISHIAAALGVPRREVELLIRVQKLSAQRATAGR